MAQSFHTFCILAVVLAVLAWRPEGETAPLQVHSHSCALHRRARGLYAGTYVQDASKDICAALKKKSLMNGLINFGWSNGLGNLGSGNGNGNIGSGNGNNNAGNNNGNGNLGNNNGNNNAATSGNGNRVVGSGSGNFDSDCVKIVSTILAKRKCK